MQHNRNLPLDTQREDKRGTNQQESEWDVPVQGLEMGSCGEWEEERCSDVASERWDFVNCSSLTMGSHRGNMSPIPHFFDQSFPGLPSTANGPLCMHACT